MQLVHWQLLATLSPSRLSQMTLGFSRRWPQLICGRWESKPAAVRGSYWAPLRFHPSPATGTFTSLSSAEGRACCDLMPWTASCGLHRPGHLRPMTSGVVEQLAQDTLGSQHSRPEGTDHWWRCCCCHLGRGVDGLARLWLRAAGVGAHKEGHGCVLSDTQPESQQVPGHRGWARMPAGVEKPGLGEFLYPS